MSARPRIFISAVSKELREQRDTHRPISRMAAALVILLMMLGGCSKESTYERACAAYERKEYVKAERLALQAAFEARGARRPDKSQIINALEAAGLSALQCSNAVRALTHFTNAANLTDKARNPLAWARVQRTFARALLDFGQYAQAESRLRPVVTVLTDKLESKHLDTLDSRYELARALYGQGKYAEAEAEDWAVLPIRERVLGPEHPDTLRTRINLARALRAQGKHAEAEAECRAVLKIEERVLGPEHPDTLDSRTRLANAISDQGKYVEAEAEYRAVLKIQERVLGLEHPRTLDSLYNLALCMKKEDKMEEAREFARRAAEGGRKVLDNAHPYRKDYEDLYAELTSKK